MENQLDKCCEDETLCENCEKQAALQAGIPLSVIEGKTKLSDHFSEDYINWKTGRHVKLE